MRVCLSVYVYPTGAVSQPMCSVRACRACVCVYLTLYHQHTETPKRASTQVRYSAWCEIEIVWRWRPWLKTCQVAVIGGKGRLSMVRALHAENGHYLAHECRHLGLVRFVQSGVDLMTPAQHSTNA